jgi:hypothetical protein
MPKLSVSVPDDVWAEAASQVPALKASALVQEALRTFISTHKARPAYAALPNELTRRREAIVANVAIKVRRTYLEGYEVGLNMIDELPWDAIEDLERVGWDVYAWDPELENYQVEGEPVLNFDDLWMRHGEDYTQSALQRKNGPSGVMLEGLVDAFKDVVRAGMEGVRLPGFDLAAEADSDGSAPQTAPSADPDEKGAGQ